jgi:hypothetical protein
MVKNIYVGNKEKSDLERRSTFKDNKEQIHYIAVLEYIDLSV